MVSDAARQQRWSGWHNRSFHQGCSLGSTMVGQKIAPTDLIHNCRLHDMSHEQPADARTNTSLASYMCPDPIGHLIAPVLSCPTTSGTWV